MIKKIVAVPSPILRQKSKPIKKIDKKIKQLAGDLVEIIKFGPEGERIGVGISAIQIGQPLRLFIAYSKKSRKDLIFINPKIIWKSKKMVEEVPERKNPYEGCLSIPGIWGKVRRHRAIRLRYLTLSGRNQKRKFDGFIATVIQHELDHLNGILFTDRILKQKGKIYQLEKSEKGEDVFVEVKIE